MIRTKEAGWQQYKADFLRANKCTVEDFQRDWLALTAGKSEPDVRAYRLFARKYKITIHHDPMLPEDIRVILCVGIAAIKIVAQTYAESEKAVAAVVDSIRPKGRLQ